MYTQDSKQNKVLAIKSAWKLHCWILGVSILLVTYGIKWNWSKVFLYCQVLV
jgi:hypothetical protein